MAAGICICASYAFLKTVAHLYRAMACNTQHFRKTVTTQKPHTQELEHLLSIKLKKDLTQK